MPEIFDSNSVLLQPVKTPEQKAADESDRNNYFNIINKNLYYEKYGAIQQLLDEYRNKYPDSEDRRYYFYSGILNEYRGNLLKAIDNYQKAILIFPEYSKARTQLGFIYMEIGKYTDSVNQLLQSSAIDPYNPFNNYFLGLLYLKSQKFSEAEIYLQKACQYKTNYGDAYNSLGIAFYHLNKKMQAVFNLNNAIKYNSATHETYFYLGKCLSETGREREAFAFFLKSYEIQKNFTDCLLELGRISFSKKEFNSAIKYFIRAESMDFENNNIRLAIADCYFYLNRFDEAIDILQSFTGKRPERSELPALLSQFRKGNSLISD
jgi:tetratricopeptide (TPR) repeat protein